MSENDYQIFVQRLQPDFEVLLAVKNAFRRYAVEVGATEWAPYSIGNPERHVSCLQPLIASLAAACGPHLRLWEDLPLWIQNRIEELSAESPANDGSPVLWPTPSPIRGCTSSCITVRNLSRLFKSRSGARWAARRKAACLDHWRGAALTLQVQLLGVMDFRRRQSGISRCDR